MGKRVTTYVSEAEIEQQKEYIEKIRICNEELFIKEGKQKTMFIETYGCQQNSNDTERLKGMLHSMGYIWADKKEHADIILYNTCAVRENAELKVYGNVGTLKPLKKKNPDLIIGLCGCMMQQSHIVEEIKKKYRHVDLVFGTQNIHQFPEILFKAMESEKMLIDVWEADQSPLAEDLPILREDNNKASVPIMTGCNNYCTYCIVPYVRGRERSRLPEKIVEEVRQLAEEGYKEIQLLGQNVNSYGRDLDINVDFADLLYLINEVEGIKRIRFMTPHPKDLSDKVITALKECDKVCNSLHLPFQAGSNKILKAMNRTYTREQYLELIDKIRAAVPDIAFSTDIIVGFPGETEEDFEQTLDIVRRVGYEQAFMFIYSKRKGTPAAEMPDVIDEETKHRLFTRLVDTQNEVTAQISKRYEGQTLEVLVEGTSKNDINRLSGRTTTNKIVNFEGDASLIGQFVNVKVTDARPWFLIGELVK